MKHPAPISFIDWCHEHHPGYFKQHMDLLVAKKFDEADKLRAETEKAFEKEKRR